MFVDDLCLTEALFCVQVFQPAFRDLRPPMLDLFDLDETFSSEKVRLAQLSNKCEFLPLAPNAQKDLQSCHCLEFERLAICNGCVVFSKVLMMILSFMYVNVETS